MTAEPTYVDRMITADELLYLQTPDKRVELVRGILMVHEPAGLRHGEVAMQIARRLANHVEAHGLGKVYAAETGFVLARGPDTVRAPDVAFISSARVPDPTPTGFPDLAPDLAVEVLSPGDRPGDVLNKVADWLSGGSRLVWVVDPARNIARVYRSEGSEETLTAVEALDGEDVVPGFTCGLSEVL